MASFSFGDQLDHQLAPVDPLDHVTAAGRPRAAVNAGDIGVFEGDVIQDTANAIAFPEGGPRRHHVFNQNGTFVDRRQDRGPTEKDGKPGQSEEGGSQNQRYHLVAKGKGQDGLQPVPQGPHQARTGERPLDGNDFLSPAEEHGNQGEREHEGNKKRGADGKPKGPQKQAGNTGNHDHGQKSCYGCKSAGGIGSGNLHGSPEACLWNVRGQARVPEDIFGHHDGVIHNHADSQRQGGHGDDIQ